MGLFGGGGGTTDIAPFLEAAAEAQQKGSDTIADFESIANDFAGMGAANYSASNDLYGNWKYIMDSYYSDLNANEFGAQEQQKILQAQSQQTQGVSATLASAGIDPNSTIAMDINAGQEGMMSQAQIDSEYAMYEMQNQWNNYGIQQQAMEFDKYSQGVGLQGQQANSYVNMYAGQASNALSLAQAQQQYNDAAEAANSGGLGSVLGMAGSLGGAALGASYGGPAGAMAGSSIGGGLGTATGSALS